MGVHNGKLQQSQDQININHPVFENAKLTKDTKARYMTISMGIQQKDYARWKQTIGVAKRRPQFLLLPVQHSFGSQGFCGSVGTVDISYDLHPYILHDEIQARRKRKSSFQECELWFLLYVLAGAKYEMKQVFGTKVGDIRPINIFVNEDGQVQVACVNSWPGQKTGFQKAYEQQDTLISPEQMNKLQLGGSDDLHSHQCQMFSIGMSILSAGLMQDLTDIYDTKKMNFEYETAQKYLYAWSNNKRYSQILTGVVCNLCEFQPHKRLTEDQLWFWIREYRVQITNKNKFVIVRPPLKVQRQVHLLRGLKKPTQTSSNTTSKVSNKTNYIDKTKIPNLQGFPQYRLVCDPAVIHKNHSPIYAYDHRNTVILAPTKQVPFNLANQQTTHTSQKTPTSYQPIDKQLQTHNSPSTVQTSPANIHTNQVSHIDQAREQKQVQASFTPLQSKASSVGHNDQNSGNFVYTRRFVNPNTYSLLGEQSINESQYHQGIMEKNLQAIQEKNSVAFHSSNHSFAA